MKKLVFIGMATVLAVTLAMGIATLYADQTDFGMMEQGSMRGQGYAQQQDGGSYSPNNRGWRQRFQDWAYGMMGRGRGMGPGMRNRGWGTNPGMMDRGWGMGRGGDMGSGRMGRGWGMGPGMMGRGGGWGMGSGMMGRGWGMGSGCQ